jgi:hypothetical protein
MPITEYVGPVARASTTSDVFNAVAEAHRREILDALMAGEKAVGAIVNDLSMSQPQVSKHLRVLSEVGLVRASPAVPPGTRAPSAVAGVVGQVRAGMERPTGPGWMTTCKSYNNKESGSDT